MTIAVKITGTALALTAIAAGALIAGLALIVHTHERRITEAGDWDEA